MTPRAGAGARLQSHDLPAWFEQNGRHHLPWRSTRDRWQVLVSEVMLHQTQVSRVAQAWPAFMAEFPTPGAMVEAGPAAVIRAWGRLGYPRRARRLHDAAVLIVSSGWPNDLRELPGVGRYTAAAVSAQADGADTPAVDVNVRRVLERVHGRRLTSTEADVAMMEVGRPLMGRDRLLALMDVGAHCCRPTSPRCGKCPLRAGCTTRGVLPSETRSRQAPFVGSFRARRGDVLASLRARLVHAASLDQEALGSLVDDGLAVVRGEIASLP